MKSLETLEAQYRELTPKSRAQWEKAKAAMPAGIAKGLYWHPPYPVYMDRGEECYVWDLDERRYVDYDGHFTAMILGPNPPSVRKAVQEHAERGLSFSAPIVLEEQLAEELRRRVPSLEQVRFTNSGTEAGMQAARLVRAATGKPKIAKFEGAYHGSYDALQVSVGISPEDAGDPDAPASVPDYPGMSRDSAEDTIVLPWNRPESVELILREHQDELAAVFYDAKPGMFEVPDEFTHFVRGVTEDLGILIVMDEVISFRMGYGGFQGECGVTPDLTMFGKVIGGGMPVGAFGGRSDLMSLLDDSSPDRKLMQSGTFSAHPLTLAAGLANLEALTHEVYDHLDRLGARLYDGLMGVFERTGTTAQVVSRGSIVSTYFTDRPIRSHRDAAASDRDLSGRLGLALRIEGYLMMGQTRAVISAPMQDEHVDGLVLAIEEILSA